jgi:hypothetical protein
MNRKLIIYALVVVLGLALFIGINRPLIMYIGNHDHRFDSPQNDKVLIDHTFEIINAGIQSLEIKNIISSCGCSKVDWPSSINAFSRGKIDVKVLLDITQLKPSKYTFALETNDVINPIKVLTLTVFSNKKIAVDTKELNFGSVIRGEAVSRDFTISAIKEISYETMLGLLDYNRDVIKLTLNKIDPGIASHDDGLTYWNIKVSLINNNEIGEFNSDLKLSSKTGEKFRIPCNWIVMPDFLFYPERFTLSLSNMNQDGVLTLLMRINNKNKSVQKVELLGKGLFLKDRIKSQYGESYQIFYSKKDMKSNTINKLTVFFQDKERAEVPIIIW